MERFKLIIVEDDEKDLQAFWDSVEVYKKKNNCDIECEECKTVAEAERKIDNSFDGIIIDLRLDRSANDGNEVMNRIQNSCFRIPIAVTTGTPGAVDNTLTTIGIYKKGEYRYEDILKQFHSIYQTGLTRIMGGRGKFEKILHEVFHKNLLPQRKTWVQYTEEDQSKTETALLRYTLNHLNHALEKNNDNCFPEEVYINPPLHKNLETGSILNKQNDDKYFILLTPSCDLVKRNDACIKTDRLLLIEIEEKEAIHKIGLEGITKLEKKEKQLKVLMKNNYTPYFHWLPQTEFFNGGYINFRKVHAVTKEVLHSDFYLPPKISVSPAFVKDIISRYSSFYARQGQPDIDNESAIREALNAKKNK